MNQHTYDHSLDIQLSRRASNWFPLLPSAPSLLLQSAPELKLYFYRADHQRWLVCGSIGQLADHFPCAMKPKKGCLEYYSAKMLEIKTYRSQTKITKRANTCIRIEQKICRFDVAVDNPPGMYIA